jgi:hypothetical protein
MELLLIHYIANAILIAIIGGILILNKISRNENF